MGYMLSSAIKQEGAPNVEISRAGFASAEGRG